ncbi:DUF7366 family protein [Staphylococcus equorum]|uniref:DUF7366 family protein n=1 Tax=Staphylococcus equorum TaxID=246432 RepID=UPI0025561D55|nr:hypothetical protein [Staphylococcus equorum]MDK9869963.1 hypothetical protein [Staphylococcus equorum]
MIKLSKDILEQMGDLDEMTPEQQQDIEQSFLESVRDKESPQYSSFLSGLSDDYLLSVIRMMFPSMKKQVKQNKKDDQ